MADLIDRETELLDDVTYRLSVLASLAETGRSAWIARGTEEVEEAADMLRLTGLLRATRAGVLARDLGLDATATLSEIVAAVSTDDVDALAQCRRRLAEAIGRAQVASTGAQAVLGARTATIQEALENLATDTPTTYAPAGSSRSRGPAIVRSLL